MNATSRKALSCILCVWFAIASTLGSVAHAQAIGSDFEAPIIEHEEITSGTLGDVEVFSATVVDNEEVESVSLFYRFSGEDDYTEIAMQQLVQSSSYAAKVDTQSRPPGDTAIEYYIRADDSAGNVVLKGLSFDPLTRTMIDPDAADATTAATAASDSTPDDSTTEPTSTPKKINWLYVGLGALLVGGIAAAAGGGGDDGGGGTGTTNPPPGDCDPTCTITFTVTPP